jgi:hypothetical protein
MTWAAESAVITATFSTACQLVKLRPLGYAQERLHSTMLQ